MFHVLAKRALLLILLLGSVFIAQTQTLKAQVPTQTKVSDLVVAEVVADDPSQGMDKLVDLLKKERAKGPEILVVRVEGIEVKIGPEPRPDNGLPVYPNPLFLLASVDAQGNLILNSEKLGNLTDTSAFTKRLVEIFKEREENGVFRSGSNDVEKTVSLRLDPTLKVSNLNKVVSAMDAAGSEPIILLIDPPAEVVEAIFPLRPSTSKKPKKRNR
ncbi:MAG: hypothetical protein ABIP00_10590 [Pyrinomonadaceae bacterium]